jgi:MoxR-like ATPase
MPTPRPDRPADVATALAETGYLGTDELSVSVFLALQLKKPLIVEGPAGVGKTELARACAAALDRPLIRLQCYEGLDESRALYEWDYAKQILFTQLLRDTLARLTADVTDVEAAAAAVASSAATFFDRRFLVSRPLLAALESDVPTVLLIDEVDRADPEFEAFLLEFLSDLAVTIPELGTVRARHAPLVVLTTNGTREMTEALRRRCLHVYLDYPTPERELGILAARVPGIDASLAESLVGFIAKLRAMELRKAPSVSETIDWARALIALSRSSLDADVVQETLGVLLKHGEDRTKVEARIGGLLAPTA